jgi:predicted HTH domain antitoxin
MAHDKRYVAQKRQRRRRKAAKSKVKLFEQGKVPFEKLPELAKLLHHRKVKAAKRTA